MFLMFHCLLQGIMLLADHVLLIALLIFRIGGSLFWLSAYQTLRNNQFDSLATVHAHDLFAELLNCSFGLNIVFRENT